jgi:hypothetical protein
MAIKANVIAEILSLETQEDLRRVFEAAKERWHELDHAAALQVKVTLSIGDKVSWESKRRGSRASGTVIRLLHTRAKIKEATTGASWVVPMGMLKKEA